MLKAKGYLVTSPIPRSTRLTAELVDNLSNGQRSSGDAFVIPYEAGFVPLAKTEVMNTFLASAQNRPDQETCRKHLENMSDALVELAKTAVVHKQLRFGWEFFTNVYTPSLPRGIGM
jgi:hypothetical protein